MRAEEGRGVLLDGAGWWQPGREGIVTVMHGRPGGAGEKVTMALTDSSKGSPCALCVHKLS